MPRRSQHAIHSDHLNTPRKLTRAGSHIVWQWPYSAFGDAPPTLGADRHVNPLTTPNAGTNTMARVEFNLRYPGQHFDKESNLSYNYFRSYRSQDGRYTQADPIGLEGGWNRFGYVRGNPLSKKDPLGLEDLDITDGSFVPAGEFQSYNPTTNTLTPSDEAVCIAKCMAGKAATGAGIGALGYGALEVAARTGAISPLATVGLISVYKQYGKYYSAGKMAVNLQQCESQCDEKQCKAQ